MPYMQSAISYQLLGFPCSVYGFIHLSCTSFNLYPLYSLTQLHRLRLLGDRSLISLTGSEVPQVEKKQRESKAYFY